MRVPRRGDFLQRSRDLVRRHWTREGWRYAARLGRFAGVSGLAIGSVIDVYNLHKMLPSNKRRRGASGRSVVSDPNVGGYQQRKTVSDKNGRKRGKRARLDLMVQSHIQSRIERFQDVDPDGLNWGRFQLNYDTGGLPENKALLPCYLFELNSVRNQDCRAKAAGFPSAILPIVCSRLTRLGNANFAFDHVAGRNSEDNAPLYSWTDERGSSTVDNAGDRSYIDWIDFRLLAYGAQSVPVDITVQLISFTDPEVQPWQYVAQTQAGTGGSLVRQNGDGDQLRFNEFWHGFIATKLGNPLSIRGTSESKKGMKVYWSKTFRFQPNMTTEGDATPHQVEYKWRRSFQQMYSYVDPRGEQVSIDNVELGNPNEWTQSDQTTRHQCHPSKDQSLYYLMVTGTCAKESAAITNTASYSTLHGSFDLIMRRKRSRLHIG